MAGITINSNVASLNAQRRLQTSTTGLRDAFSRLSSGLRINKASDDAAGLSISSALNTDRRVYDQGVRNLNDGMSLLSVADGALEQLGTIMTRLSELAEQAANGALQFPQRKALDAEAQALKNEFKRITQTTTFNGLNLLSSALGEVKLQTGFGLSAILQSDLGGAVGSGTFQTAVTTLVPGGSGVGVDTADFNGDGFADILGLGSSGANGVFTVQLGDGQGGFTTAQNTTIASGGGSAAIGDINGDGILDVVTAGNTNYVLLGNGNGTFRIHGTLTTQIDQRQTATLADINGDGILDLAIGGAFSFEATAAIRLGNGNGTFRTETLYTNTVASDDSTMSIDFRDVNNDGKLDMLTGNDRNTNGGYATVQLGNGQGGFGGGVNYTSFDFDGYKAKFVDMNNDGKLDVVQHGFLSGESVFQIAFGNGSGGFGGLVSVTMDDSSFPYSSAVQDLNGDGAFDLIAGNVVRLGNGNGTFTAATTIPNAGIPNDLAFGDINSDGVMDLISAMPASGAIKYHLSNTLKGVSPLSEFSLQTLADARQALPMFRQRLDQISKQRGKVGAFQSRIETALANTSTLSLNVAAAASQITNADVAEESAQLLKQQILQQMGTAVLAQANQGPALALRLLQL